MTDHGPYERPAIAGSGTIACGLAAVASGSANTLLIARSEPSAQQAAESLERLCGKLEGADAGRVRVVADAAEARDRDLVVEAIVEDVDAKGRLLAALAAAAPDADLATTTSSLSITELAHRTGRPQRFFGMHVFNPVPRMELVELCFPTQAAAEVRGRARAWCEAMGKTAVEVPDRAGFVVNRLLFPYLFDAVRLLEETGMHAEAVDECMRLGAGHPMGPLALLDFVGIDVAVAIGEELHRDSGSEAHRPPRTLVRMLGEGCLGRKTGSGFHRYD